MHQDLNLGLEALSASMDALNKAQKDGTAAVLVRYGTVSGVSV